MALVASTHWAARRSSRRSTGTGASRAVVVHLKNGPPPAPDGPIYNSLASGRSEEPPSIEVTPAPVARIVPPGMRLDPPGRDATRLEGRT